mgnify:CR=1 FL=1
MPVPRPASSLAFTACGSKVECANAPVPFDPADPAGEQITLFVSRRPANDAANRLGVLFVNPGGPGDPAFDLEALLFQDTGQIFGRLVFVKAQFAEAENLIHHLLGEDLQLVHFRRGLAFQFVEGFGLLGWHERALQ